MGIISVEHTDRLYWLGRYSERVYTTIRIFSRCYDTMLDAIENDYSHFCDSLEIPNIYTSREDFVERYCFDERNENSLHSNLLRAYDNAVVLREEIGSETLSYIQLALYEMQKARRSEAPLMEFQRIVDNILAFWGMADDSIADENVRNIIKTGKRVERVDLFARLKFPREDVLREIYRLASRLTKTEILYDPDELQRMLHAALEDAPSYHEVVCAAEALIG